MAGDAVDALDEQVLFPGGSHRAFQRLLEEDRHEQIAGAVHREQRALELPVERDDLVVRSHRVANLGVERLAPRARC